jgi:hypothetical protein
MTDFIKLILSSALAKKITGGGVEYLILPRDFHPMALQIPYFALADKESGIIAISQDVPKMFQDVWVLHEQACIQSDFINCASLTVEDIRKVRILYLRDEYMSFLKMRIVMFQAVIDAQPQNARVPFWKKSFDEIEAAMQRAS